MGKQKLIPQAITGKVLMIGMYYKNNHPGGISAVIQYWAEYMENLQYIPESKDGGFLVKAWWYMLSLIRVYLKLLCANEIKIVHIHTAAGLDFLRSSSFVKIAKLFGKKTILHSHASRFEEYYNNSNSERKKHILSVLNSVDILIVLSESWKKWFAGIGVDEGKIVILHNITDFPDETEVPSTPNIVRLLFLGEIGRRKGIFDILKALSKHRSELLNKVELRIGGNKMEKELRETIKKNDLSEIVRFEGFVSGNKKNKLLNWANVYILPSYNEGLPISILEAMSYKMPIISTPVGGIPEVVSESNGILVTPGDVEGIYNAIMKYVYQPGLISIHGQSSYNVARTYMPDYVMERLRLLYNALL